MAKRSSQSMNIPMIIISAIIAALAWFLIHSLKGVFFVLGGPIGVGLMSASFLVIMSLGIMISSKLMGTFRADVVTGERRKTKLTVTLLLGAALCFALMAGFEFLYELDVVGTSDGATTYVFIVDDSGSTEDTDPNQERYKAIQTIMGEKSGDAQYVVYSFSDDVSMIQPMQKVSDGIPLIRGTSYGGTSIKAALDRAITDYEQGVWTAEGTVQVILITDGYATDMTFGFEVDPILKRYKDNRISVSSVGLEYADQDLMNRIADKTEGEFISITEVGQLSEAVKTAASVTSVKRDIFSERAEGSYNFLCGLMRIVFIGLLGVMISVAEAFFYGNSSTFSFTILMGSIKGFVASAILEVGISVLKIPAGLVCLLAMALLATVIAKYGEVGGSSSRSRGQKRTVGGSRDDFADF